MILHETDPAKYVFSQNYLQGMPTIPQPTDRKTHSISPLDIIWAIVSGDPVLSRCSDAIESNQAEQRQRQYNIGSTRSAPAICRLLRNSI